MKHTIFGTVSAIVAGAAAMYYLDPQQGKRRRALVRDQLRSASLHTADTMRGRGRRVANQVRGWTARLASRLPTGAEPPRPRQLHNRVRTHLGRLVSHPKAVNVEVMGGGHIRLTGHVLADELDVLLDGVEGVAGVTHIDNAMMVHESAGNVAELQGDAGRRAVRGERQARLWQVLAFMAPVAILAATVQPVARRTNLVER